MSITWTVLAYIGAFLIGLSAIAIYKQGSFADTETILPHMILDLMPTWIGGLLLAGILAAIITTANSQLLVVTSSVSEDIIHRALGIRLSDRQLVWLSRFVILISGVIGMIIALSSQSLVYLVVSWAWAGVGCTLGPAILMTFFWKKYSSTGVVATILSGFVFTVVWISTDLDEQLTARFATFFVAAFFGIVFSLLFPDKKKEQPADV
ncbi:High-affinity choline transporter [Lentibacillus sp. JNUCC-1]|uniref:sodium:solute symporter family transporter n=1 Tax=Lentibacillus sp. JNUCC-1 TaxID=2654513 RepID=UPI001327330E|nr:High-affinity choline transporter [Lentibacillus sp. JNUCC-1]